MTENLTRKYQKIFAKNAGAQGKTVFGSTAQGNTQYSTDIDTMQSDAYENGFADAVVSKKAPVLQDFNTVENITTRQLAYLFQKGIPEWNGETTYFKGNIILNIENNIPVLYYSLIDNNLNNQVSDTESWKEITLDIDIENKANTSLDNLNATGQAVIDSKANTDLNNVASNIDYIIERGFNENGWYEKYKSGKIRQGGQVYGNGTYSNTLTFPTPFANTNYIVYNGSSEYKGNITELAQGAWLIRYFTDDKTTTNIKWQALFRTTNGSAVWYPTENYMNWIAESY